MSSSGETVDCEQSWVFRAPWKFEDGRYYLRLEIQGISGVSEYYLVIQQSTAGSSNDYVVYVENDYTYNGILNDPLGNALRFPPGSVYCAQLMAVAFVYGIEAKMAILQR